MNYNGKREGGAGGREGTSAWGMVVPNQGILFFCVADCRLLSLTYNNSAAMTYTYVRGRYLFAEFTVLAGSLLELEQGDSFWHVVVGQGRGRWGGVGVQTCSDT